MFGSTRSTDAFSSFLKILLIRKGTKSRRNQRILFRRQQYAIVMPVVFLQTSAVVSLQRDLSTNLGAFIFARPGKFAESPLYANRSRRTLKIFCSFLCYPQTREVCKPIFGFDTKLNKRRHHVLCSLIFCRQFGNVYLPKTIEDTLCVLYSKIPQYIIYYGVYIP